MTKNERIELRNIARGRDRNDFYAVARHLLRTGGRNPKRNIDGQDVQIDIADFIERHKRNVSYNERMAKSIAAVEAGDLSNVEFTHFCELCESHDQLWPYSDDRNVIARGEERENLLKEIMNVRKYVYDPLQTTIDRQTNVFSYLNVTDVLVRGQILLHPKYFAEYQEYLRLRTHFLKEVPVWCQGRAHIEPVLYNRNVPKNVRFLRIPASQRANVYALTDILQLMRSSYVRDGKTRFFPEDFYIDRESSSEVVSFDGIFYIYLG